MLRDQRRHHAFRRSPRRAGSRGGSRRGRRRRAVASRDRRRGLASDSATKKVPIPSGLPALWLHHIASSRPVNFRHTAQPDRRPVADLTVAHLASGRVSFRAVPHFLPAPISTSGLFVTAGSCSSKIKLGADANFSDRGYGPACSRPSLRAEAAPLQHP
jgi:hypothetical protein